MRMWLLLIIGIALIIYGIELVVVIGLMAVAIAVAVLLVRLAAESVNRAGHEILGQSENKAYSKKHIG